MARNRAVPNKKGRHKGIIFTESEMEIVQVDRRTFKRNPETADYLTLWRTKEPITSGKT